MAVRAREEALVIPGEAPLIGTLGHPVVRRGPAVVLVNAGLVHRAGPDGLHVRLSEALTAKGYLTLRVDYSGVGDSPPRRDRVSIHEARVLETRAVLDCLESEHGVDRFVLVGNCTGADNAFRTALEDSRVTGLVLMDGYPVRTWRWWVWHYVPRLFRASSWKAWLGSRFGTDRAAREEGDDGAAGWDGVARLIPTREEMSGHLRRLIERGVDLYFICTGGFSDWVNHAGQLRSAFRGVRYRGKMRVDYMVEADHVFRSETSQRELTRRVIEWLEQKWPDA